MTETTAAVIPATGRLHFAGLAGSGMSALAQVEAMAGRAVSGSDRAFDRGERVRERAMLDALGITVTVQDGSGVRTQPAAVVASTAVEAEVPDIAVARELGVPVVHRSDLLAAHVAASRTVAVAGTSGKSTVVAMLFELLRGAGRDPSVITGGEIVALQREGLWGNAWAGRGESLVVEADESDGSLTRYAPSIGVLLNLQRDHHEIDTVAAMFRQFTAQAREYCVVSADPRLAEFARGAWVWVVDGEEVPEGAARVLRASDIELEPTRGRFTLDGDAFVVPAPGLHNVRNAIAALTAAHALDVPLRSMRDALFEFAGVHRRFQTIAYTGGVEIIDDFAHNPEKIRAALATARARGRRTLAVYQPHGFGPTRFLRHDLVEAFASSLRPHDALYMLDIFYAGGTAAKDIASQDLVDDLAERGVRASVPASRAALVETLAGEAREGDVILVMGARDPSLSDLARAIAAQLTPGTPSLA